jgi:hypothetical protein
MLHEKDAGARSCDLARIPQLIDAVNRELAGVRVSM